MAETAQEILTRMLLNTSEEQDRSVGSFVFDVEKAAAIEFELQQLKIENVSRKLDIYNLSGNELTRFVYQQTGVRRKLATKAMVPVIVSGAEGSQIKKGDVVSADDINFISVEDKTIDASGSVVVLVESEFAGSIGNVPAGAINKFPTTLPGLVNVYNPEPSTTGYEEETDEALIVRYFERKQNPGKSGNSAHYKQWAKEVLGVGDAKVFPRFNGPLTMRVVIINRNGLPADEDLVNATYEHISTEMPFGVDELLVESALAVPLNLNVTLHLVEGYTVGIVIENIKNTIAAYLAKSAFKTNFVSYAQIGALIIESEGVLDYENLLINGATANIPIAEDAIAVMGGINE
ncbi:uncharacterized homolog of phage Mu protein gp47 [Solibacillus silvestris StLB046]|uniref:Uncharacterized homolog of phage Mu protein gp47 n=1 Tax=Solibacillus silvestris (strain StLB046) TaxID=1002809 RepID=F2F2M2_SOLSS|nr:baseplate J/gp47 family protein [Solibacillus silvestris]BAK15860.1 uncharacterized homolog of phage Mu protein gp47 [Solibacillus silvestris StLB046]